MNILSLDLSYSSTGYCVISDDLKVIVCDKITTKSKDDDCIRIYNICNKCKELIEIYNISKIVVENQYVSINKNTALKLSKLLGAIMYLSQITNCEFDSITPSEARSILIGNGKGTKEDVASYICEYYEDNKIIDSIGPYSDKSNKSKTSDIYDAISIGMAYIKKCTMITKNCI